MQFQSDLSAAQHAVLGLAGSLGLSDVEASSYLRMVLEGRGTSFSSGSAPSRLTFASGRRKIPIELVGLEENADVCQSCCSRGRVGACFVRSRRDFRRRAAAVPSPGGKA